MTFPVHSGEGQKIFFLLYSSRFLASVFFFSLKWLKVISAVCLLTCFLPLLTFNWFFSLFALLVCSIWILLSAACPQVGLCLVEEICFINFESLLDSDCSIRLYCSTILLNLPMNFSPSFSCCSRLANALQWSPHGDWGFLVPEPLEAHLPVLFFSSTNADIAQAL